MRRGLISAVLVIMVVLAGCSGVFGGSGEPTETLTPATVPTDEPTPTPVPRFAPGLTGQGIENASALVAAHTSVLEEHSFTVGTNTTTIASNGSVVSEQRGTLRVGPPGTNLIAVFERNGSVEYPGERAPVRTVWANDTVLLTNETSSNGTTTYDRSQSDPGLRSAAARIGLRYTLEPLGPTTTSVTERTRNGTTLYLVRGRIRSDEGYRAGNRTLRLLVDSRGVIHELRVISHTPEEDVSRVVSETRFSGIGSTDAPGRPSWVGAAIDNTTAFSRPTAAVDTVTVVEKNATRGSTTSTPIATDSP